jgi:hypothetical protein
MSNAILYRMAKGIPGDVSRQSQATIEAQPYGATAIGAYGLPVKLVSGLVLAVGAGDTSQSVYGFLVRPYPITGLNASDPLGTSVPPTSGIANVLKRGYIAVNAPAGTVAAGGQVYVRTIVGGSGRTVGEVEGVMSDPANQIAIPGCFFLDSADANGNVEVAYNL